MPNIGPPILLAEDDEAQATLVKRVLTAARLTNPVRVAQDGEDAVSYVAGTGAYADRGAYPLPVLILLDLHLPRRSGLEVLGYVRRQPGLAEVPIIMLSASTDPDPINRAMELGATSYLVKPVAFDALVDTLRGLELPWALMDGRARA